jgi:hypothetical protein
MAVSVTTDLSVISTCDSTTDGGTHYRLAGTSSANPAADADAMVQNNGCIANKCGATATTDVGGHFNHTSTFDLTSKLLVFWRQIVTPGNMLEKVNLGITLGLTNTSTTSTSAWSTTNYKKWYMDGKDTMPITPGWVPYALDPSQAADASAGTLTLSTVKNIGFICRQGSGITTTVSNQFYDAIRMGTGLTLTCSSGADAPSLASIYNEDNIGTNRWGLLTQSAGIYYGLGKVIIGSVSQTNVCNLTDSGQVFVWRKSIVPDTQFGFDIKGASSNKTTVTLTGCVIRGQSGQKWNVNCTDAYSDFKLYSSSIADCKALTLSSTSVLSGSTFSACGTADVNGATISGCTFSGQTATPITATPSELSSVSGNTFISPGTGHGLEITGTAGSVTLTNMIWTNYAASDGSTGNEAVYINIGSGSMNLTISGGTTPSVRTAGCTVTVISGAVTVTATIVTDAGTAIQNARVFIQAATGGPMPYDATVTIANSGTTATVTHTTHGMATNDKAVIRGASHDANNGIFTITKIDANSYSYTMGSSPGSNPTGAIKATYVVLHDLTNASGQVTMSRVFASSQPYSGWARKSSSAPYYKAGSLSGTISSSTGATPGAVLVSDD